MKDRLSAILNENKLTAWKFAEILGIQPSSLSHIFSGRNRASLDLIEKVLRQFPLISPDWLLFGRGDMYRVEGEDNSEKSVAEVALEEENSAFELSFREDDLTTRYSEKEPEKRDTEGFTNVKQVDNQPVVQVAEKEVFTNVNTSIIQNISLLETEKDIESIMVFYTDSTFKIYKQSK